MDNLAQKQLQLKRRNQQLEARKRQIQAELEQLQIGNIDDQSQKDNDQLNPIQQQADQYGQSLQESTPEQKDIIGQIEGVRKHQSERNQQKLKDLKRIFQANRSKLLKNKQKLQKLDKNLTEAQTALNIKTQLKNQLQSKGKKISEESRKWITDISKLTDKNQDIQNSCTTLVKEEESLKNQLSNLQKRLEETRRQRQSYEHEHKLISNKAEGLKEQIENGKKMLKQKQSNQKQEVQKNSKNLEKIQINKKRVEKQKNEIIKAYKKLNQQIALLRKMNLHLQTAATLNFPIKEYLQAIDKADIIV